MYVAYLVVYVFENLHCNFANLVAPPTDRTKDSFSALKSPLFH